MSSQMGWRGQFGGRSFVSDLFASFDNEKVSGLFIYDSSNYLRAKAAVQDKNAWQFNCFLIEDKTLGCQFWIFSNGLIPFHELPHHRCVGMVEGQLKIECL